MVSNDKADRWLYRVEKRLGKLTPEDVRSYHVLRALRGRGEKLDSHQEKILIGLERKV